MRPGIARQLRRAAVVEGVGCAPGFVGATVRRVERLAFGDGGLVGTDVVRGLQRALPRMKLSAPLHPVAPAQAGI